MTIPFARPCFSEKSRKKILASIDEILASGRLIFGEQTRRLEDGFADLTTRNYAISTNSCTTALQICLSHYDIKDAEILVPAASFLTDISTIHWCGGKPVLVDINPSTLSFDINDLKRKVTSKTKGIIWVHLTGLIASNWREIVSFAKDSGLFLIEDCAHAHGASIDGYPAGSLGDSACFSFYATKVMTCGSGGILVTNNQGLARTARELRLFGRENGSGPVVREGNDWFLDEVRASIAAEQLDELPSFLHRRQKIAARYKQNLRDVEELDLVETSINSCPSWYLFPIFLSKAVNPTSLKDKLQSEYEIPTSKIYPPIHEESIYRHLDNGTLKNTSITLNRSLCLPMHADLTDSEVDYVSCAVKKEICKLNS